MDHNLKVGKIAGIEIDLHYTWFIVLALLSFGLAIGFFPERYPGLSSTQYWVIGIIAAILLFISVLIHELTHAGFDVSGIGELFTAKQEEAICKLNEMIFAHLFTINQNNEHIKWSDE